MGDKKYNLKRALLAELFGCFVLTFVDGVLPLTDRSGAGGFGLLGRALGSAFVVMTMIFCFGEVSGAHINPAVTLAFTCRKVFPKKRALQYIAVQIVGALAAGLLIHMLFGQGIAESLTLPHRGELLAAGIETLLTWFLVTTILATSCEAQIKGWEASFPVGCTLIFCGLVGKDISGASMNPARSLGVALAAGNFRSAYIYLFPFLGALFGVASVFLMVGIPGEKEAKAAQGS